jgi:CO/xanthine dehydrogenase Mo-binding subunit
LRSAPPRWGTDRSPHRQIAASILGARADSIAIINADTDLTPYDTGTFASTGTVVAGQAVALTATALRDNILDFASRHTGVAPAACRLDDGTVVCDKKRIGLPDLHIVGTEAGHRFEAKRRPTCRRVRLPSLSMASGSRCTV